MASTAGPGRIVATGCCRFFMAALTLQVERFDQGHRVRSLGVGMTLAAWLAVLPEVAPEFIKVVMAPGAFDHVRVPVMRKCHQWSLMFPKLTGVDLNHFFLSMGGRKQNR